MSTLDSPRPLHPFPHLLASPAHNGPIHPDPRTISPTQRRLLGLMAQGARILFDIQAKRALVYGRGLRELGELSVRMLAHMVRQGWVIMTGREGRLVHYTLAS